VDSSAKSDVQRCEEKVDRGVHINGEAASSITCFFDNVLFRARDKKSVVGVTPG
jgi:hypothetical protein